MSSLGAPNVRFGRIYEMDYNYLKKLVAIKLLCCRNLNYQCNSISIDYGVYQVDMRSSEFERCYVRKLL